MYVYMGIYIYTHIIQIIPIYICIYIYTYTVTLRKEFLILIQVHQELGIIKVSEHCPNSSKLARTVGT